MNLIHRDQKQSYYPGAFFIHFPSENHFGPTAVSRHLEYFHDTGLDLLKIQYERKFPFIGSLKKPSDWAQVPLLKKDFYAEQLKVIEGIIKDGKKEALVIPTVYSPLSFAGHFTVYADYSAFTGYPCHNVNGGLDLKDSKTTTQELYRQFQKPIMGGLNPSGIIYSGSTSEIETEVSRTVSEAPEKLILGATCTLPRDIDWVHIKTAVDTAHNDPV